MKTLKVKNSSSYPKKTVTLDGMDLYSLCRWASLKEAIDLVGEKCEEKNIDFDTFDLKPLDLLKYVETMTDELYNKVSQNKESHQYD
jgi:hypothetical protein